MPPARQERDEHRRNSTFLRTMLPASVPRNGFRAGGGCSFDGEAEPRPWTRGANTLGLNLPNYAPWPRPRRNRMARRTVKLLHCNDSRLWPYCDITRRPARVRFVAQTGKHCARELMSTHGPERRKAVFAPMRTRCAHSKFFRV